jgi:hypothetical protein
MTTSIESNHTRGAMRLAAVLAASAILAACNGGGITPSATTASSSSSSGGGGTTVSASPYLLYASNYVIYSAETNGSFLHSVQNGNLYTNFTGNLNYGCGSSSQTNITATQFYYLQVQADSNGGPPNGQNCQSTGGAAPTTAGDGAQLSIQAPGTSAEVAGSQSLTPLDISQATTLLIQMGNIYTQGDIPNAVGGNATVFTVTLNNDTSVKQDGSGQTAICYYYQTLGTIGRGTVAPLGMLNYAIPLSSFGCANSVPISTLLSTGVTSISVGFTGDQNPNLVQNEYDVIAVGYVGFTM